MSGKQTTVGRRLIGAFGVALVLAASCAWGAIITPLYVGNLVPVLDQFGNPMAGSDLPAEAAGRCRVELRIAKNSKIIPPTVDGMADESNPLVTPDSVCGIGQDASTPDSGIFCMVFTYRLPPGTKIFARVFNAPTLEESTFYVDSLVARVPKNGSCVVLNFGEAQPLDTRDIDADGLINSWETVLGTDDRFSSDYDGDGISDLNEWRSGTSLTDETSQLAFSSIQRDEAPMSRTAGGDLSHSVRVRFQSVPGRTYEVQYMSSPLVGQQEFTAVGIQTANADQCEMLVDVPSDVSFIILRLRLIME